MEVLARRAALCLLLIALDTSDALALAQVKRAAPRLAVRHRTSFMCEPPKVAGGDSPDEHEPEDSPLEDLDLTWQQFRLTVLSEDPSWWATLRLEALEGLPKINHCEFRQKLQEGMALFVGISTFVMIVKAYLASTGGIVIVPDDGLIRMYNFNECASRYSCLLSSRAALIACAHHLHRLNALEPARLQQLHLPVVPVQNSPVSKHFFRLLLGGHELPPPA